MRKRESTESRRSFLAKSAMRELVLARDMACRRTVGWQHGDRARLVLFGEPPAAHGPRLWFSYIRTPVVTHAHRPESKSGLHLWRHRISS